MVGVRQRHHKSKQVDLEIDVEDDDAFSDSDTGVAVSEPMRPRIKWAIGVAVACAIYWIVFFGVTCGATDICTTDYFVYSGNFTIFGSVRTSYGEYVGFSVLLAFGTFLSSLNYFFLWPIIGSRLYSKHLNNAKKKLGINNCGVVAIAAFYTVFYVLFLFMFAMGSLSNLAFLIAVAVGTCAGYGLSISQFVFNKNLLK
jgi:hypothetical protein